VIEFISIIFLSFPAAIAETGGGEEGRGEEAEGILFGRHERLVSKSSLRNVFFSRYRSSREGKGGRERRGKMRVESQSIAEFTPGISRSISAMPGRGKEGEGKRGRRKKENGMLGAT